VAAEHAPLAAIDIGTNSIHLLVARALDGNRFEVIDREKEMVRLGSGSGDMKVLEPAAIARGIVRGAEPEWLRDARLAAAEGFTPDSWPTGQEEEWRRFPLKDLPEGPLASTLDHLPGIQFKLEPEAAAVDSAGNLYVADRAEGVVVRLNPEGRVLDPRFVTISHPRLLAVDDRDHLWIGSDGSAEAPYQQGPGEIVRVSPRGVSEVVYRGPVIAALGVGPGGTLFVADRHEKQIFVLAQDGKRIEFASFTDGDVPRSLGFAPVTPEARRAGVAGDLFVVTIKSGTWLVNEVLRISGPFDDLTRPR